MSADDMTAAYTEVLAEHTGWTRYDGSIIRCDGADCDWATRPPFDQPLGIDGPERRHRAHVAAVLVASPATKAHEAAVLEGALAALAEEFTGRGDRIRRNEPNAYARRVVWDRAAELTHAAAVRAAATEDQP